LICSTPVFREARKKYPDAHISVIANPVTKELLEYNPNINEIITVKKTDYKGLSGKLKLSGLIRKGKYDIGICLNPNIPFAIALFWGLVPIRLSVMPDFSGFTFKLASVFFTHLEKHASGRMVIETYMQMLKAIGISSNDISKEVYKSKNADAKAEQIIGKIDKPLIGIAVSSGNKLKELGVDKIAGIVNMILDDIDADIVLVGSEHEIKTADAVLQAVGKKDRIINTLGKLHLKELPALIERLSLFIGVDTGITYMADALSIPLINIAGPSDMKDQRPTGKSAVIIQKSDLPCVPCSHTFKSPYYCKINTRGCIESIEAEDIFNRVKEFLLSQKYNL
ncbi:MAG: glycosyltransferase family 9 protein, partial [Nitrospirae bacterium]|nr:glycosyltransferase family 9 protein [Nitrospirota bacterium]